MNSNKIPLTFWYGSDKESKDEKIMSGYTLSQLEAMQEAKEKFFFIQENNQLAKAKNQYGWTNWKFVLVDRQDFIPSIKKTCYVVHEKLYNQPEALEQLKEKENADFIAVEFSTFFKRIKETLLKKSLV